MHNSVKGLIIVASTYSVASVKNSTSYFLSVLGIGHYLDTADRTIGGSLCLCPWLHFDRKLTFGSAPILSDAETMKVFFMELYYVIVMKTELNFFTKNRVTKVEFNVVFIYYISSDI